jgi:hypothetical protein
MHGKHGPQPNPQNFFPLHPHTFSGVGGEHNFRGGAAGVRAFCGLISVAHTSPFATSIRPPSLRSALRVRGSFGVERKGNVVPSITYPEIPGRTLIQR